MVGGGHDAFSKLSSKGFRVRADKYLVGGSMLHTVEKTSAKSSSEKLRDMLDIKIKMSLEEARELALEGKLPNNVEVDGDLFMKIRIAQIYMAPNFFSNSYYGDSFVNKLTPDGKKVLDRVRAAIQSEIGCGEITVKYEWRCGCDTCDCSPGFVAYLTKYERFRRKTRSGLWMCGGLEGELGTRGNPRKQRREKQLRIDVRANRTFKIKFPEYGPLEKRSRAKGRIKT